MGYTVKQLVEDAKVAIDENVSSKTLDDIQDTDTLKLDEIIESKVVDAVRLVESNAAHHLLGQGRPLADSTTEITWEDKNKPGEGTGRFKVKDNDFLRLVIFRMSDWYTPVTEAISEQDPEYLLQSSRLAGVRGNPQRPVVAVVHGTDGQEVEFFSCDAGRDVSIAQARYIPKPSVKDGQVDISPLLHRAVVYRIAAMTTMTIGATDAAAMMLATSNELAGILPAQSNE